MKKLITIILILALLLPAAALADLPDISGLTSEELLELNQQIQMVLFSQQLVDGVSVPPGVYVVGEDIPSGTYRVEITGGTGFFDVYKEHGGSKIQTGLTGSGYKITEFGKFILEDGNELKIVNSTFVLFPYTGLFH